MSIEHEPAWSDDAEATLEAVNGQLEELPSYSLRMNVLVNAMRHVMTREAYRGVTAVTGSEYAELPQLVGALQWLVDQFIEEFRTMPKRIKDVIHAETGCGNCEICRAARRDAYADGKAILRPDRSSQDAIEKLIATMLGKTAN